MARRWWAGRCPEARSIRLKTENLVYGVAGRGVFVCDDVDPSQLLAELTGRSDPSPALETILAELAKIGQKISVIEQRVGALEHHVGTRPTRTSNLPPGYPGRHCGHSTVQRSQALPMGTDHREDQLLFLSHQPATTECDGSISTTG
jgi:hypothetical protein